MALRGVNAGGTVGDTEPSLSELVSTLGYSTVTGVNGTFQATTRAPVGDEVVAPYFKRVDSSKPVGLYPVARYVAATSFTSDTGYAPTKYSGARTALYRFPADTVDDTPDDGVDSTAFAENQKLMPSITAGGATSWNPTGVFGSGGQLRQLHRRPVQHGPRTGPRTATSACYPAKSASGALIPNTWIVGVDVNVSTDKNYDYQDQVMLLTNATPELTAAAAPGQRCHHTGLRRPSRRHGARQGRRGHRVLERAAEHCRHAVQADAARPHQRHAADHLHRRQELRGEQQPGQRPAAARGRQPLRRSVQGRILGPMSDLTAGYQQKAVWFGPDQNNYLKIEIEHRTDTPGVFLTVFREEKGVTSTIGQIRGGRPVGGEHPRLPDHRRHGHRHAPGLYRINSSSDAYTPLGPAFVPTNPTQWFSTRRPGPASSSPTTGRRPRSPASSTGSGWS